MNEYIRCCACTALDKSPPAPDKWKNVLINCCCRFSMGQTFLRCPSRSLKISSCSWYSASVSLSSMREKWGKKSICFCQQHLLVYLDYYIQLFIYCAYSKTVKLDLQQLTMQKNKDKLGWILYTAFSRGMAALVSVIYTRTELTAEVGWVLERDHFLLHSLPWFCVALALSLWLVLGSCWRMEVSSWLEVFSASQCPLSVGLSTLAVCREKSGLFVRWH